MMYSKFLAATVLIFSLVPIAKADDLSDLKQMIVAQQREIESLKAQIKNTNTTFETKLRDTNTALSERITAFQQSLQSTDQNLANTKADLTKLDGFANAINDRTWNIISDPQGTRVRTKGNGTVLHLRNDHHDLAWEN